ncbi:MAG: hypothetical protein H0U66_06620 [Gemmatimonadaceae bacterium]|nr:hypothetical protein [Gemmatimonadaceae bacterium]
MPRPPILFALVALLAVHSPATAQSCPVADAVLGPSKSRGDLKSTYDKFADTTTLETKMQSYNIKDSQAWIGASFVVKHVGAAPAPMTTQLHLIGAYWWDHGVPVQIPAIFSDSAAVTVLADSAKFVLRGASHTAPKTKTLVTSWEDMWIGITPEQLAELARAHAGGMRLVDKGVTYDMQLKGNLTEAAAAAYRTAVCAPSIATAAR